MKKIFDAFKLLKASEYQIVLNESGDYIAARAFGIGAYCPLPIRFRPIEASFTCHHQDLDDVRRDIENVRVCSNEVVLGTKKYPKNNLNIVIPHDYKDEPPSMATYDPRDLIILYRMIETIAGKEVEFNLYQRGNIRSGIVAYKEFLGWVYSIV